MKELCAAALAVFTVVAGCATAIETIGGGEGGDSNGSASGGGGVMSLCAQDCSMLAAPACYRGVCNEATTQCEIVPDDGAMCDDGLFCTMGETCSAGTCGGGSSNPCSEIPGDGCSGAVCNEEQDKCLAQTLPDGTSCLVADDLCTVNATCKSGVCSGAQKDCFFAPPPDECHTMACSPASGNCEPVPGNDGVLCTDPNDLCTIYKVCSGGMCQGGQPKCANFGNLCANAVCDPATGGCSSEMIPGSDGILCDDGNACTDADACLSGVCTGTPSADYEVYLNESFSSNAAGWTLGPEWEIGPAMASVGFPTGFEDPDLDHTASADNGIAGVVIGGYAAEVVHAMYYLESPTFDGNGMGQVHLQFWRHLNSDYTPYMNNVVEVYNGAQWTTIWQSGPSPALQDSQWMFISHDITAYKSANMKIRFGFDIGSSGVFTVSSWNIDDVVVASKTCP